MIDNMDQLKHIFKTNPASKQAFRNSFTDLHL